MHRADLTSLAALSEAHYTDLLGNAVKRFHDKYKDAGNEFFVNFNPVLADERDKTILGQQSDQRRKAELKYHTGDLSFSDFSSPLYQSPSSAHSDPVGTYGYPAEYVANHWYDLDYGKGMKYMRVLKVIASADRILKLNDMGREDFLKVMKKLNLEFSVHGDGRYTTRLANDAMMIYEAIFEHEQSVVHFRVNSYGKTIFGLIQREYTFEINKPDEEDTQPDEPPDFDERDNYDPEKGDFEYRGYLRVKSVKDLSAQKQNERARAAGYDVILDRSQAPLEATIHPNEPEQAIFLTKRSYEVVEVFNLPEVAEKTDRVVADTETIGMLCQKLAGRIAKATGDSIASPAGLVENGRGKWGNLNTFRRWLATEQIERVPAHPDDPTMAGRRGTMSEDRIEAWLTAKGRMIVIAPERGDKDGVHDSTASERSDASLDKVRIRPGEGKGWIRDNLQSFQHNMDKKHHRSKLAFDTTSFLIGIVSEAPVPAYVQSAFNEKAEETIARVKQAMVSTPRVVPQQQVFATDISAKPAFKPITKQVLDEYLKAVNRYRAGFYAKPPAPPAPKPEEPEKDDGIIDPNEPPF
jgi:hypothetical protein